MFSRVPCPAHTRARVYGQCDGSEGRGARFTDVLQRAAVLQAQEFFWGLLPAVTSGASTASGLRV